jgi:NAD(P)-dependent dehydrogenase (short-subunit alcohol dehydrogenase family)
MSVEDWRHTLSAELDTVFFGTKFAWPHLVKRGGGVIINTASVAGMRGSKSALMVAHAAGKAGVIGMTRQVAVEGAEFGIRAVSISPGPIDSAPLRRQFESRPEARRDIEERTLVSRVGQPQEIADLAAFLASDKASFITGVNYVVDGGMSAF